MEIMLPGNSINLEALLEENDVPPAKGTESGNRVHDEKSSVTVDGKKTWL
jgi:hypothetical protein